MSKKIRIYCSGGCGLNIGQKLIMAFNGEKDASYPEFEIALIDTSTANLNRSLDTSKNFYHIQGDAENPTDGSGMVRKTNYPAIVKSVQHILQKFPPGDFNIFVQSASGGSGSVISPTLMGKLIEAKKPFVVIMVGSRGCEKEITNTIDTLESLQGISQKHGVPICCHYYENGEAVNNVLLSASGVDNVVFRDVMHWMLLLSDNVTSLDSKDIQNFLNYTEFTSQPAGLTWLSLVADEVKLQPPGIFTCAAITLKADNEADRIVGDNVIYPYHVVGFVDRDRLESINVPKITHVLNNHGFFQRIIKSLKQDVEKIRAAQSAAMVSSFTVNMDDLDSNGMKI